MRKKISRIKRGLAVMLSVCMVFGMTPIQAGAEENDSEIAVQANDSAGRTEQQSTDEASVTINGTTLYYATLEEAFSAANGKYATINMLKDAECINYSGVPFCVDSWESDITLKMNGKTLSGLGKEDCGAITVKEGSLAIQGPGTIMSIYKGLSCEFNARYIAVENVTFNLHSCDYGIWVDSMYPVILDNVQVYGRAYEGAVYIKDSGANVTINNMSAPGYGYCDVVYNDNHGLIINGGTFDKISGYSGETSVSNVLGEGCIYRNNEDKTWVTSDLSNTYEISNVTVEKIPLTINPAAEATSWYYNSAEYSLQMNAQPTTTGNEIIYEWYDGDKKLECTSDTYTVPKTTPIGSHTYTCKATCDGYTLSHDFTFTVEEYEYEHEDVDLDGKCDICGGDFKTYEQLGKLITKVKQNLSDGKYADVQYTTASIDSLRKAIVAAGATTADSSDTDIATAFDTLLTASTVGAGGLIKADHNIVISFADAGAARGIASGNGWYANGDTVTLKVTPSVGYIFSKWTKDTAGNTSVGTESTYTFTLGADSPDAYYAWLDEVKYTVTCESVEGGTGIASEEQYVYGQTATVTATANDNYEFVGWKDSYGTTVSTDAIYSFTVIGDTTLTPEFVKVKTEEGNEIAYVTVSFYHQSGKLLDSRKVVSGEEKITTTVNAPTKVGFDFLGWSAKASGATAEDVVDFETATFSENTSLYPVFKVQDITYTLTVVGLQTEQKAPQSSVTVTADPIEGKQFVGWKDANGNIVSYDSTYTFIITGDTTLEACYEQADSEVVKEPTIIIGEPIISEKQQGVSKKATMYFNYDIPGENELVDIGVVYVSGKQNTLDMNTPGVVIRSAMSTINASPNNVKNQFYYSKTMTADSEYTFMGYIVYTDSSGKRITKYSDLKNASYND